MRIVKGTVEGWKDLAAAVREQYDGRFFVYQPVYQAQLAWMEQHGPGEYLLAMDGERVVAAFFIQRANLAVTPIFLDQKEDPVRGALRAFFGRSRLWIKTVVRPSWDLRVGEYLLPLLEEAGFAPGPPERLFRLRRSDYQAGYDLRESVDGSRVDYRMHDQDIDGVLDTLTPLLKSWSGFYGLEGHSEETCRLFTASVDAHKAAVLWVLLPAACGQEQNDCYLHWKEEIGDDGIFVRSTVTEDPFRGKGIGSSLHRFMLSRFFKGPDAVDSSWISTNDDNRASVGLLESLGYRRQLVCRYHLFLR
jgi:GNAT superfamily N-acetyltransferase